jgi:hypothetical protein
MGIPIVGDTNAAAWLIGQVRYSDVFGNQFLSGFCFALNFEGRPVQGAPPEGPAEPIFRRGQGAPSLLNKGSDSRARLGLWPSAGLAEGNGEERSCCFCSRVEFTLGEALSGKAMPLDVMILQRRPKSAGERPTPARH